MYNGGCLSERSVVSLRRGDIFRENSTVCQSLFFLSSLYRRDQSYGHTVFMDTLTHTPAVSYLVTAKATKLTRGNENTNMPVHHNTLVHASAKRLHSARTIQQILKHVRSQPEHRNKRATYQLCITHTQTHS